MADDISSFLGISPTAQPNYEPPPISNTTRCHIFSSGQQQGPYMSQQITAMWHAGTLTADTLVFPDGYSDWIPIDGFLTRIRSSNQWLKIAVPFLLAIVVVGLLLLARPKPQVITGYETKILFVGEDDYSASSKFRELTHSGWEIKNSRRAWAKHPYRYDEKQWGEEYTLQKALYGTPE